MSKNSVYQRDLLYPTENISDPGSVHVAILNPNVVPKMPVLLEPKTAHSPIKYIESIIRVMQTDIFDRILVDIKKNVNLYIKTNDELKKEYQNKEYIKVTFVDGKAEYSGVDDMEL